MVNPYIKNMMMMMMVHHHIIMLQELSSNHNHERLAIAFYSELMSSPQAKIIIR